MFSEHCCVTGAGWDWGQMGVHENIVSVVRKLAASRGDRHRTANFAIHYLVSVGLRVLRRGLGWELLWGGLFGNVSPRR